MATGLSDSKRPIKPPKKFAQIEIDLGIPVKGFNLSKELRSLFCFPHPSSLNTLNAALVNVYNVDSSNYELFFSTF